MSWKSVVVVLFVAASFCPTLFMLLGPHPADAQQTTKPATPMSQPGPAAQVQGGQANLDPLALGKAIDRVAEKRERFEKIMKEVRKTITDRPKMNLKGEIKVLKSYNQEVIPFLRTLRAEVLKNRGSIHEAYLGYMDALRQAITTLDQDSATIEKRLKSDKQPIKSTEARDHLIRLAGTSKNTADKFADRLKQAQEDLGTIDSVLTMVDESGLVLDFWEGQVKAMLEAGERGETAMKSVEGLRDFARKFQDAFDQFLAIPEHLETTPAPAIEQEKKS